MMSPAAGPSPDGLPPLREVIRNLELSAKKSLGQNFILDLNLTRRLARLAGPLADHTVIEIGPGPGGLTRGLLMEGAGQVVAIERDPRCRPALEAIGARYPDRFRFLIRDALDVDWGALVGQSSERISLVANLPYNIATRLLIDWLQVEPWPPWWQRMTLMFQKEVAERIVAGPSTKAYGRLAVMAQWRTQTRIAMTLGPEAFTPPPAVASAVVEFLPRPVPEPCSAVALGRLTAAAFGQRRKMLRQSLRTLIPEPLEVLAAAGIGPELRAEQLTVSEFVRLARMLDAAPRSSPAV